MNGKIVDTNILIYLSKKQLDFYKVALPNDKLFMSVITYMEVLGYRFKNSFEKDFVEKICGYIPVIGLDKSIVEKVISIRQNHKIKLPDAIILATSLVNNYSLITADVDDFLNIDRNLEIINPVNNSNH
ncbi:MAG TPA: type II toxin-antitoxin system VapC family toxin [Prolixibacteraceae bacterium]|nr:type II toxin-antitoxin system VapC family toxin [Prolixibacteraceae bacterium]